MNNNIQDAQELLDAFEIFIKEKMKNVAKINKGICQGGVSGNKCNILMNGKVNQVTFYGNQPITGNTYPVFLPGNNMSTAFIIVP